MSDDSHGPERVGENYDRVAKYIDTVGIGEIYYLERREALNTSGRRIGVVRHV